MLSESAYVLMECATKKHGDDFWDEPKDDAQHNIHLLKDVEEALAKEGFELVLQSIKEVPS